MTRRLVSGIIAFVGSTPISWTSKRQGTIESSSYSAKFCAGQVACEEAIAIRYMLCSLGVPVPGPTRLCGDNLGMIMSLTNPESKLKKNHVAISFHKLRECATTKIVNLIKVCTTVNCWAGGLRGSHSYSLHALFTWCSCAWSNQALWG